MSRRNPMNARYQKHTSPAGKTRRSAAAAKPKREAGTSGSSSAKSTSGAKSGEKKRVLVEVPESAKKWRRAWFVLLGAGFVLALVSMLTQKSVPLLSTVTVIAAYVCIGAGILIDFRFVRPAIHAARHGGTTAPAAKDVSAAKADDAADTDVEVDVSVKAKTKK